MKDTLSGSSAGIHCHHDECIEALTLDRTTTLSPTHEEDYEQLMPALDEAALFLGWRVYHSVYWCPMHVVAKKLVCVRCHSACPACWCMDGPRVDAVDGLEG